MSSGEFVRRIQGGESPQRGLGGVIPRESEVVQFLLNLYDGLYNRNAEEVKALYEQDLAIITDNHFKTARWPSISEVAGFYSQSGRLHSLIMALYSEIYYRHVFYLGDVTYEDRLDSWEKYCKLLGYFVDELEKGDESDSLSGLVIPASWAWDIVDEFVYQLQECCRWRSRLSRTEDANVDDGVKVNAIWKVPTVLEMLHRLAVNPAYKNSTHDLQTDGLETAGLGYQLGYFASISLVRLHVLLGDYYTSVRMAASIDYSSKFLYWKVPSYYVSLSYHLGFAYMMLRRYGDCIKILSQILIFLTKQRSYLVTQSYQQGAMAKLTEKMYIILVLCHTTTKIRLDETLTQTIKEQYANRFYQLQSDNEEAYRDAFLKCCPKFIDASSDNVTSKVDDSDITGGVLIEPVLRQLNLFLKEISNQRRVDEIYSFAKLYHNISLEKLAALMKMGDDPELVRSCVLSVKHQTRQFANAAGGSDSMPAGNEGDIDLYIDQNVLYIKSKQSQKLYVDYFLQQINRCKHTLRNLQSKT
ncbi:EUKARYOTIC TRANSLATION INITIATION FACTOR 3, putative [Babesia bigemina]|uniref:Eukaryotic translation initiation factor 3 subunit L n=1 Tax=Babesia bigemina TaxID=5866 RepID=A0A061D9M9_BABBI|nr:EUKARYOTIC TRANSLATION INITIATION FACTOR 3, putative [Babesia bigemina]CDR97238.1 EUKARYOTIC TRANSLATION INITIATION FACTOR 3, putative [Babesia bigemina]|eukprot:XP_012769424.1 EUKARYOTIC TRANSLATION INITIATION FACTOR 3, putative [Babesia bigemina]